MRVLGGAADQDLAAAGLRLVAAARFADAAGEEGALRLSRRRRAAGASRVRPDGLPANTIAAGEFVLGYPNAYGQLTARPTLAPAADARTCCLRRRTTRSIRDLGMNGSYLVFRQLRQDVHGFWRCLAEPGARKSASETPSSQRCPREQDGRAVGRAARRSSSRRTADDPALWRTTTTSCTSARATPTASSAPSAPTSAASNPRDALDPQPGSDRSIEVGKRHRILRRGRAYGPPRSRHPCSRPTSWRQPDDRPRTWPLLHLLQHPARPAVRVHSTHLAEQPQVRRALRGRRSDRGRPGRRGGEAGRDLHRPAGARAQARRRPAPIRDGSRRGLFLHARDQRGSLPCFAEIGLPGHGRLCETTRRCRFAW